MGLPPYIYVYGSSTQTVDKQLVPVGLPVASLEVTLGNEYMPSYTAGCSWFQLCMPS
jgi:hypothetical protein